MAGEKVEHALRCIEKSMDEFVQEFEMIGLILLDRQGQIITTRNLSDLFDTSRLSKMVSLFPGTQDIEAYYRNNSFSWLIFQNDSQSLLVHPVGDKVVLGMLVNNEISLSFYKQQVIDLAYQLAINFNNLYQALQEES